MYTHLTVKDADAMTASVKPCTTESGIATALPVQTDAPSNLPANPGSPLPPGGNASRPLCGRLTPPSLTPAQEQMMLGTMLGDGHMWRPKTSGGNPNYTSRHGWVQHAYNCHKSQMLLEFVHILPRKEKNGGFGKWSSVFHTLNCPAFWPIVSLCLDRQGRKRVTQAWLDRLGWEGVAWWYQDDGSLQLRNTAAVFHTEGFSREECELLASWFTSRGLGAHAHPIKSRRRKGVVYYSINLTVAATEVLMQRIRPYVHRSMRYKTELCPQVQLSCPHCGKPVEGRHYSNRPTLTCGRAACVMASRDAAKKKYAAVPKNKEKKNAALRAAYAASGVAGRRAAARKAKAWRDANPSAAAKIKKRHQEKIVRLRAERQWTCRECGKSKPQGSIDSRTKYCPACREKVTARQKEESRQRAIASGTFKVNKAKAAERGRRYRERLKALSALK